MAKRDITTPETSAKRGSVKGRSSLRLTCSILMEDDRYVARCLEVMAAAPGKSVRQAVQNLKAILELYFAQGGSVPVPSPAFIEFVEIDVSSA